MIGRIRPGTADAARVRRCEGDNGGCLSIAGLSTRWTTKRTAKIRRGSGRDPLLFLDRLWRGEITG
ncbi:MAG: hypothetical protein A3K19_20005 [Lentisphaerae bacterium RIFOXYB12_FULL_65_16]|nr:MAG: hypothetical protein A3K18_01810 [Lentisphaerae bacterium RIFOXYA12_64_32]OGV87037.1 MAG: hypothetical protein A3K19_20005 [Lentisphaerae bacterium RIFOXYB12_FULL_65_16]